MTNTKQLPLPRRAPTFILPKRKCRNCGRLMAHDAKYPCCSYGCQQEYAAMLARIEAADKEETEMPF